MFSELQFKENVILSGKIRLLTGLHIGGSKAELKIGGTDNPVITDVEGRPYIPGSSLKGKLRCLFEISERKVSDGKVHNCNSKDCPICLVFGSSSNESNGPTRLVVRDAKLDKETVEIELKTENMINRLSGKAEHPRTLERVPAGTVFNFEMVYSIYENGDYPNFRHIIRLLSMLEDSYLGGSGSRGYGKVAIEGLRIRVKELQDYQSGTDGRKVTLKGKEEFIPKELLDSYDELESALKPKT